MEQGPGTSGLQSWGGSKLLQGPGKRQSSFSAQAGEEVQEE